MPLLSVDTAYDPVLRAIRSSRQDLYNEMTGVNVDVVSGTAVSRDYIQELCTRSFSGQHSELPYYDGLTICSHGSKGKVFYKSGGHLHQLLSVNDSPSYLSSIVYGKSVYLFACETANSMLLEKIMDAGAIHAIGFTKSPKWGSYSRNVWLDIDEAFLRCYRHQAYRDEFVEVRNHQLARLKQAISNNPYGMHQSKKKVIRRAIITLSSMKILS